MQCVRRALGVVAVLVLALGEAHGYEFQVRARTVGQGHQLRSIRFLTDSLTLDRRRFTQIVSLSIWDLGGRLQDLGPRDPRPEGGPNVYLTTYFRVDHDFGSFTTGSVRVDNRIVDAIDAIPELEHGALQLDVLYAYLAAEDLAGGWLSLYAGRQLEIQTLDWFTMDGLKARAETPWRVSVEAFGGFRVRETSYLGSPELEPDGTSAARCEEYVEGTVPGSGSWRPIDREVMMGNSPFTNDYDFCPQREELMPTFGAALELDDVDWLYARLSYRRTVSQTPGLLGPVDRLPNPDVGLYPNEQGQAPAWGVNEERLAATVRAPLKFRKGELAVTPYAGVRYSLLHGLLDEAHLGTQLRWGAHALEPEIFYSFPTFDGDSIFNVFSIEPYTDVRVTYDLAPKKAAWSAYARAWGRIFSTEDVIEAMPTSSVTAQELAGGVQVGARLLRSRNNLLRADLFHEDGYGGRRTGSYATGRWQATRQLALGARLTLVDFAEDSLPDLAATTVGAQLGATYLLQDGVAFTALIEENSNRFDRHQLGIFGILDLAFHPET